MGTRSENIAAEAKYALARIDSRQIKRLSLVFPVLLSRALTRRIDNIGNIGKSIGTSLYEEAKEVKEAYKNEHIKNHLKEMISNSIHKIEGVSKSSYTFLKSIIKTIRTDPKEKIPALIAGVLGFEMASGGLDGDGGMPDLDLALGIAEHRSLLTHSILMGSVVEAAVLTTVILGMQLKTNMPQNHDPVWDKLDLDNSELIQALLIGTSTGMAYHMGIDTTVDGGGTYAAIEGMPLEVHQIIMGLNAFAEGLNAKQFSIKNAFQGMDWKKILKIMAALGLVGLGVSV